MKKLLTRSVIGAVAGIAIFASAPAAFAGGHNNVNWSINIGAGYPVYAPPAVVYVQPQPVYVQPRPVYVQPAAVVTYGEPYYAEPYPHHGRKHWKHHHPHGHGYRY